MINSVLDIRKPETLVTGLEAFVGLLRNKKEAKNVDVQLYLEDFEKLQFKMEYLEGSTLDLECVEIHYKSLQAIKNKFDSDEDSEAYIYIVEFGIAFAEYAKAALASSSVDKTIKALTKEIETMTFETSKFEKIAEFYADQSA